MATRTITTKLALEGESEYRAKLKNINAELALQKSELEKIQAQYKSSANSLEALTAKQTALRGQLDALNKKHQEQAAMLEKARSAQQEYAKQVEELQGKLAQLAGSAEDTSEEQKKLQQELDAAEASMQKAANSVTYYQKELNRTERDQTKLGEELDKTGQYLDEAAHSADGCAKSIDQYGKEAKQAGDSSEQFGDKSKEAINQLAAALAAAGVAKSVKEIADALHECVDAFAGFQAQMSNVQAISGASGDEMAALAEKAKEMGATTSFTATEAGQALEYMAMAGWKTSDMLGGLEGIMNLAAASGESLGATSDIVTDALTAFGLKAEDSARFADVLAAASSNANTNVSMMGETFKYAAPVAGSLGYSIEDTALAIGLMANAGIKGSQAGSALRGVLTNLAKPSEQVAEYMDELGISLTDSAGNVRTLSELMDVLRDRFSELTDAQQAEYAAGIAGKEAMSGLLAIVNAGEEDFQRLKEAIDASSGAAKEMSETRLDNFQGQMTLLSSAADGLKIAIGEQLTPVLTKLAEAGTDAFTWATEFVNENEWVVGAIVGLTGALGTLVAGVGALAAAPAIIGALNTALGLLSANPIVLVAAAFTGVVTALGTLAASVEDARDTSKELTQSLQDSKVAYDELQATMKQQQGDAKATAETLKGLLAVENKSASQKEEIVNLVNQLNEAVPGLNLAYGEEKDTLEELTAAEVDSALKRAQAQEEHEAQVQRLSELRTEGAEITRQLTEAEQALAEAEADSSNIVAGMAAPNGEYNSTVQQLRENVALLSDAHAKNAAQIVALSAQTSAYAETQAQEKEATEATAAKMEKLTADLKDLETAYAEKYSTVYNTLTSEMGLFNEMDGAAKTSIDNLIGSLDSQIAYMDEYAANIQKAMEMGIDQGLLAKLSDGSQESAQYLDAIVKGGEDKIGELNEKFAKVEEGKKTFSDNMALLEEDFDKKMGGIVDDLSEAIDEMNLEDEAYKAGVNDVQGLINGMNSKKGEAIAAVTQLANDIQNAYNRASDQHSPSKKFAKSGENDVQGLIQGAESKRDALAAAYEGLARSSMESYASGVQKNLGVVSEAMAQFDAALKDFSSFFDLKASVKDLEYKLWSRTDGRGASDLEKYTKQLEILNQKQADQQEVVDAAAAAYKVAVEQYGEGTEGSYKYQKALLEEKLALQDLLEEMEKVNRERGKAVLDEAQLAWENSGLGRASAISKANGGITPYEVAKIANTCLILPDGSTYEAAAQSARAAMAANQRTVQQELPAQQNLGQQLEAMSAATINAISSVSQGGFNGTIIARVVLPDGKVLAEAVADPLVDYMDANGTPILNPKR